MTDRELRLRLRIDRLQDERDEALKKLMSTRFQLATTRSQRDHWRERSYALRQQLALWKKRAMTK